MSNLIVRKGNYVNDDAVYNVVNYILNPNYPSVLHDFYGVGVNYLNIDTITQSIMKSKERANNLYGRQLYHFIVNIYNPKRKISEKEKIRYSLDVLREIGDYLFERNIQGIGGVHECPSLYGNNVHIHFMINSVDISTGNKIRDIQSFFNSLLYFLKNEFPYLNWSNKVYYD